jgi:hypothetical protein
MWQRVPKPLRIFSYILLGIFGLLLLIIVLIQVPEVQTYITRQVTQNLEKQWDTRVDVGRVNLTFFETVLVEDIYVEDQTGDTLLYAHQLKVDIGLFALFNQRLILDEIALENAYINLYRHADSLRFNYEFIAEHYAQSDTTTVEEDTSGGFDFDLKQVRLENIRFNFIDDSARMELRVEAPYFLSEFETLGLDEEHLRIDNVSLRELDVFFHQPTLATADSVEQAADTLANKQVNELDSAWLNPSGFRYTVDNFTIENSHIRYLALDESGQANEKVDFEDLELADLNLELNNFYLAGDTTRAELNMLSFLEQQSTFRLNSLAAAVEVEQSIVTARLREFITANSRLDDEILIQGLDLTAGDELLAKLEARADIEEAVLSMKDAAYFTDALDTLPNLRAQDLLLSLNLEVADKQAAVEHFELRAEDGFYLNARAYAQNIDAPAQLRFDVQLQELTTSMAYLEGLALVEELPPGARQAGRISLTAQAQGTASDAQLAAQLRSGVGSLQTNIIYKAPTENQFLVAGNIDADRFDLRPFAGDTSGLGTISFQSRLRARSRGEAVDLEKFSMLIQSLEFNDYTYEGLALEGHFIDSAFEAAAAYQDPFLAFDFLAKSDLKDSLPLLVAEGRVDRVNLLRLNLMEDSIIVSTNLYAELQGSTADDMEGILEVRDTELIRGAESWTMDSLIVSAHSEGEGMRKVALATDHISASLQGKYLFEELPQTIDEFISYYHTGTQPEAGQLASNQEIAFDFIIRNEPVFMRAFIPELELTYPMVIQASLQSGSQSFKMNMSAPGILYDSIEVRNLMANANTDNGNINYEFNIDRISSGQDLSIRDFSLAGRLEQDSMHFDLGLGSPLDTTHLILGGALLFPGDTIMLALDQTDLALYGQDYMLADDAVFLYAPDYLSIDNFTLQYQNQRISIFTEAADTPEPRLIAEFRNFEIADFLTLAGMEAYGVAAELHGDVQITDAANLRAVNVNLNLNDLLIDSIRTGNVAINLNKLAEDERLQTDISLQGPGNDLRVSGFYHLEDTVNALNLDIALNQLQLAPWEPFVSEFLTDLSGSLEGEIEIRGSVDQPQPEGFIRFGEQTAFRLAETDARYRLRDQQITMDSREIGFNQLTLLDEQDQQLVVNGAIEHEAFDNFRLNLDIDANNFELVNKPRSILEPFFGRLYVRTNMQVRGPLDDIRVAGDLRINEDTDFTLVMLDEAKTVGRHDYINFVERHAFLESDTASVPADTLLPQQLVEIDGLSIRMNIHLIPEARFNVIVDPATGDNLEISGDAELLFRMDPLEGMNLQGTFTVADGRYRLSFLEVIQKNFDLQEGSTVEFDGDPMNAELNMTAIYRTETTRTPLIEHLVEDKTSTEWRAASIRRPAEVLLSMVGTLEDPAFTFNITVPESERLSSTVEQQLSNIRQDQTKLFKQVFGLIVLNRFLPEEPSIGGGEGGGAAQAINSRVDQSLSSFLTDQLNALTQDYLGVSIEIDVESRQNLQGQDAGYTEKDIGLQLGRSFFNDRVEVKVGGTTGVGGTGGTAAAGTGDGGPQFAGNFEVIYRINESGNLNLMIFQRNQRDLMTQMFIPQPGVALSYSRSFNMLQGFIGEEPDRREILKSEGAIEVDEE